MADVHSKCANCRYFLNAEIMGSCRRYPHTINRHMNDWCGEHALAIEMYEPEPPKEAPPEPIQPMVYDIQTDTVREKRKYTRREKS